MNNVYFRTVPMLLAVLAVCLVVTGCGRDRPPPPTTVSVVLQATPEVNPDRNNRASPLLVRVYELRSAGVFESSDFFTLLEQDSAVLGADQIGRWEYQLEPGERAVLDAEFRAGSGYIGVVAAYRDIEHARWRALHPLVMHRANDFEVTLDRLEVSIRSR
jgi:type VI secretion system protein VasD